MSRYSKMMVCLAMISAASISMTVFIVGCGPRKPSCEERGGTQVMAGAVAVMAGQVAIPVPYYRCTADDNK